MFVLEFWHWWALALIFVVVEALILSGVFVSLAIAGLFTGMASYYYPELDWRMQLVILPPSPSHRLRLFAYFLQTGSTKTQTNLIQPPK